MCVLSLYNGLVLQLVSEWNCMDVLLKVCMYFDEFKYKYLGAFLHSVECQTESIQLPYSADASSFSPTSIVNQIFYLSNPWCASFPVKVLEIITLNFSSSVYLTRLRVRGTLVNASIYYRAINGSDVLYHNAAGIAVSSPLCI